MEGILYLVFFVAVFMGSVILHEVAHGWMALRFGDTTALDAGRVTLNPVPHIDRVGTILLPGMLILAAIFFGGGGFIIGWAKPVPINPMRFSSFRAGTFWVGSAGVLTNFLLALGAGLAIRFLGTDPGVYPLLFPVVWANLILGLLNLIPIPPLDGSKIISSVLGLSMEQQMALEGLGIRFSFVLLFLILLFPGSLTPLFRAATYLFTLFTGAPPAF